MRVLYVEDNPLDADLVCRAVAAPGDGTTVEVVSTLAAARARLGEAPPIDLLLTDLQLPDGNGIELIMEVRERALPIAVVALTGSGEEQTVIATLRSGADDYLAKSESFAARLPATLKAARARFLGAQALHARPLRVLYGEHQLSDIDLTRRHLDRCAPHMRLEVAHDAAGVLERVGRCDILLLDYRLPGENGLEVLKIVREDRGLDLPVVLITGQGSEEVVVQAMRLGATEYVVKHANYLHALPATLESAVHRVAVERERATLEQRVRDRTADLEEARRELEAFSYAVSHDLRSPLRAIDGLAAVLATEHVAGLDERGRKLLDMLRSSVARMDRVVTALLEFARTANLVPRRVAVDVAALVRHVLEHHREEAERRGVEVVVAGLPPCRGDAELVLQVLGNLVDNAFKFTRRALSPRIEIGSFARDGETVYFVRDNGIGFDPHQADWLFTAFHRLHGAREFEGTGIGLAIVERIVRRHGGRAWAESTPGQGACFMFTLGA